MDGEQKIKIAFVVEARSEVRDRWFKLLTCSMLSFAQERAREFRNRGMTVRIQRKQTVTTLEVVDEKP